MASREAVPVSAHALSGSTGRSTLARGAHGYAPGMPQWPRSAKALISLDGPDVLGLRQMSSTQILPIGEKVLHPGSLWAARESRQQGSPGRAPLMPRAVDLRRHAPSETLWLQAKKRALDERADLRDIIIKGLELYLRTPQKRERGGQALGVTMRKRGSKWFSICEGSGWRDGRSRSQVGQPTQLAASGTTLPNGCWLNALTPTGACDRRHAP